MSSRKQTATTLLSLIVLALALFIGACDKPKEAPALKAPPNPIKMAEDEVNKQVKARTDNIESALERSLGEPGKVDVPEDGVYRKKDWAGQKDWAGPTTQE